MIPGVKIVEDDVDARGRHGFGISRGGDRSLAHWAIIIDRDSYDYLGMRDTVGGNDQFTWLASAGVVDDIGQRPARAERK